jgi:hypothetical protein
MSAFLAAFARSANCPEPPLLAYCAASEAAGAFGERLLEIFTARKQNENRRKIFMSGWP